MKLKFMKAKLTHIILTGSLLLFQSLQNCGYEERGHSNTPPENPGSQTRTGIDTTSHPGNIDQDSIHFDNR